MRVPTPLAAAAAEGVARALGATWRYRTVLGSRDGSGGEARVRPLSTPRRLEPAVYALWHEHLLPLSYLYRGSGAVALVSEHRDGEILARVLERMGYGAARGSSTRGGRAGLEAMIEAGEAGRPLAFTPDGPRGPARSCKPGVVRAAAETGLQVVPVAAAASRYRRLGSWDRFLLPSPWARIHVGLGPPIEVPSEVAGAWRAGELTRKEEVRPWTEAVRAGIETQRRLCERSAGVDGRPGAATRREATG